MRASGVRDLLIYCADNHCQPLDRDRADQWPDQVCYPIWNRASCASLRQERRRRPAVSIGTSRLCYKLGAQGAYQKKELAMTKGLLVSVAVLALSTSAALAAHRTHHRDAMNAFAAVPAPPVGWIGGVNSSDHTTYLRNLRDSGYNPKNNINAAGNIATQ
jgi:hypothetical protein